MRGQGGPKREGLRLNTRLLYSLPYRNSPPLTTYQLFLRPKIAIRKKMWGWSITFCYSAISPPLEDVREFPVSKFLARRIYIPVSHMNTLFLRFAV